MNLHFAARLAGGSTSSGAGAGCRVTGSCGRHAKRLDGLGAKVAVADLNLRSYEEFEPEAHDMTADSTVAKIEAMGGTAMGIEVDVTDHEAVDAMVARVVQEWG